MDYYQDLQEANERRNQRLSAYCEHMNDLTKNNVYSLLHRMIKYRKLLGKSQQDISEATGIATSNIARLESCKSIPTIQVLARYASALDLQLTIDVEPVVRTDKEKVF